MVARNLQNTTAWASLGSLNYLMGYYLLFCPVHVLQPVSNTSEILQGISGQILSLRESCWHSSAVPLCLFTSCKILVFCFLFSKWQFLPAELTWEEESLIHNNQVATSKSGSSTSWDAFHHDWGQQELEPLCQDWVGGSLWSEGSSNGQRLPDVTGSTLRHPGVPVISQMQEPSHMVVGQV